MVSRYEQFSGAIACIYHDIQRIERVEMRKYGLKGPHAQCLLAMARCPDGVTAAQLCQSCEKDKAAISRTVAELVRMGMVCRDGSHYRTCLTLTEQGRAAARAVNHTARLAVEQAGAGLEDGQREVFYQVLDRIAGNLHTLCKDGLAESPMQDKEKTLCE